MQTAHRLTVLTKMEAAKGNERRHIWSAMEVQLQRERRSQNADGDDLIGRLDAGSWFILALKIFPFPDYGEHRLSASRCKGRRRMLAVILSV